MEWTPQQEAFFEALCSTDDGIEVDAVAGSGKTSTIKEGSWRLNKPGLAVAFNVAIKKALDIATPPCVEALTLNGLGHRALMRLSRAKPTPESTRVGKITTEVLKEFGSNDDSDLWFAIKDLVSKAKVNGLVPEGAPFGARGLIEDTVENWQDLADHYDLDFNLDILDYSKLVLLRAIKAAFQGDIDFDDQLYLPICFGAPFRKFPLIYVDEAQDLSSIQHEMLKRSLDKDGRIISVGDPYQAIYGFRGALSNSMGNLREMFSLRTMPLSVCWRCSKSVIRRAQEYVPHIQHAPNAPEGSVDFLEEFGPTIFRAEDVVLCRNNGPLITLAYKLLRSHIGVTIVGRDFGRGLTSLIKKISNEDDSIETVSEKLFAWQQRETAIAKANEKYTKLETIIDKAESLLTVIENTSARNARELIRAVDALFMKEGLVKLSTIHKFKGQEADRVFFLDPWRLPSRWAKEAGGWMLEQERNLLYVGTTRARKELFYINLDNYRRDK